MHPYFVLSLAALIGLLLSISWLKRTAPTTRAYVLKRAAFGAGIALLIVLALTGRLHWLFALIAAAVPLIQRLLTAARLLDGLKSARGPTPGRKSTVETAMLRMSLEHDTGEMDGEVRTGSFAGQRLSALTLGQLLELFAECRRNDQQSAALLEAYLDRTHGDAWRSEEATGQRAHAREQSTMNREDAYAVLGLRPGASKEEIIEAHRRLMQRVHPDRGGSDFLAAKINQAKELLLQG